MNIDDATWIGINQEIGNKGQEACQYNKPYAVLMQQGHHHRFIVQIRFGRYGCGYAQILGTGQSVSLRFVAHHQSATIALGRGEILNQVFTVAAIA